MAPDPADLRRIVAVLSACNFTIGLGAFVIVGLVEPIAADLAVGLTAAGGLLTAYAVGVAVFSPLLVALTGGLGRRRVLMAGLAIFAATSALAAVAPGLWALYPARLFSAVGSSLVAPISIAVAAALSPPGAQGRGLAAAFFGFTLAQVIGLPLGSWLAYALGWRMVFAVVAALALICLVLVARVVPRGLRFAAFGLRDLGAVLRDPLLLGAVAFTTSFLTAIYMVFSYLPTLLRQGLGFGPDGIALALFVYGAAGVAGNLLGGRLTDALGARKTLVAVCLAQILLLPLFGALPLPLAVFWAVLTLWGMVGWAFTPAQQARLMRLDPDRASVVFALNGSAIYVGIAAGSAVSSIAFGFAGAALLGPIGGVLAFVALVHLLASIRAASLRARG